MEAGRDATARTPPVPVGGVGVRFSGQGNDYFRIWIADLLCMMLTGGLYWPWLRRRRWLFLDANTWVGAHRLADLQQTPLPGVWPPRWQLLAVGAFIIGLWLFITRSMGIFGWPMLVALFSVSGPLWLYTGWRARLGLVGWRGAPLDFQGDLLTACLVWIRMCLPLVPAGLLISALFLDNFRLWLLGGSWTSRYGLTTETQELIPWMVALSVALAMANWYHAAVHFGLGHVHHPDGVGRSRLHFWPRPWWRWYSFFQRLFWPLVWSTPTGRCCCRCSASSRREPCRICPIWRPMPIPCSAPCDWISRCSMAACSPTVGCASPAVPPWCC